MRHGQMQYLYGACAQQEDYYSKNIKQEYITVRIYALCGAYLESAVFGFEMMSSNCVFIVGDQMKSKKFANF